MADRAILATLPKLNGSNWFEWKKEAETFLMLASLNNSAKGYPGRGDRLSGSLPFVKSSNPSRRSKDR